MKHRFLISAALFALSVFGGTSEAKAADPSGHRFCDVPLKGKEDILARMNKALAADKNGYAKLDGCRAAPIHFLQSAKVHDPKANLQTVADLPGYIAKWRVAKAKKDYEYESDCLWDMAGGGYSVKQRCVSRDLKPGEILFENPDTGVLAMVSWCANPGVVEVPPIVVEAQCYEIHYPTIKGGAVRVAYMGTRPLPGKCLKLQLKGEAQARVDKFPQECPDKYTKVINGRNVTVVCSWDAVEVAASEKLKKTVEVQNVSYSHYGRETGMGNVLYVSEEALNGETAFCYELPDGTFVTYGVRRESFVGHKAVIPYEMVFKPQ